MRISDWSSDVCSSDLGAGLAPIRLAAVSPWSLSERMTQEKDAFGFYLSAHPVDRYRHLLAANGVRSFAALAEAGGPVGGGRTSASMAALVEEARWRTSASGKRDRKSTRLNSVTNAHHVCRLL